MDFADRILALAARIEKQKSVIQTEEAAKTAFVMPFIQVLGYDVFDPIEVVPEFVADVGSKKGEKIDYAVMVDGTPSMLFECKSCASDLNECHAAQLRRYFHVTSARIGVLTNGWCYMFFSDLDQANIMDKKPFMEIDLLNLDDQLLPELKKLSKSSFELEQMLSTASNLKYTREIKGFIERQISAPQVEFVRLVLADIYTGLKTQPIIEQFTPLVRQAMVAVINDHINARLKSALTGAPVVAVDSAASAVDSESDEVTGRRVVTTSEELEGFYVIRAILRQVIDVERVYMRDTQSYFGVILDNSNRKPICRLHFNHAQKYLGLIDEQKKETRKPIGSLNDIYNFADEIKKTVSLYLNEL